MIVALVILVGLWSWTVLIAGYLVRRANQRADDADARRFAALDLLNQELRAREEDAVKHRGQLFAVQTTSLRMMRLYQAAFNKLTGGTFEIDPMDGPTPPRVM